MIDVYYHKRSYAMPENFNELTGKQLIAIAALMHSKKPHQEMKTLQILLNKNFLQFLFIPADAKARLLTFIDWVFGKNTLTAQLIPAHKGFYAAKGELDNLTIGEFHHTETYYQQITNGDEDAVNKLIAVIYRKKKAFYNLKKDVDGDARKPFNPNEISYYSRIIAKKFSNAVKTSVVMWYDGCRQNLIELYDKVFDAPGAQEATESTGGMYNVIRNLSGDRFGTIKEVEKIFVHNAFVEIEKIIEDNERTEAEMKKHQ